MSCEMWKFLALLSLGLWFAVLLNSYRPDLKEKRADSKVRPEDIGNVIGFDSGYLNELTAAMGRAKRKRLFIAYGAILAAALFGGLVACWVKFH